MLLINSISEKELEGKDSNIEKAIYELAEGKIDAMSKLYELIKADIFAYALSKLENRIDAEDITHDTFVQIYKNARQYKSQGKPLAWIFTIELNLIRKHYNSIKKSVSLDEAKEVKSNESDFSTKIVEGQFINEIMQILSADEREIIILHAVSGMKHREIASLIGKPLSTVLSKYNRAIKKLKTRIEEVENNEGSRNRSKN